MSSKIGWVIAVFAILGAGVLYSMNAGLKMQSEADQARIAELETDLEAAIITGRHAAKNAKVVEQVVTVADPNAGKDAAEVARLKALLAKQQEQLARFDAQPTNDGADATAKAPTPFPEERTPESMKSYFDRMKEEDPERYQQMKERMATMKETVTGTLSDRVAFFSDLDVSGLPEADVEILAQTVDKLSAMNQLMSQLDTDSDEVDAFAARREMFGQMRELGDLMKETQKVLENDFIGGLGYSQQETAELTEYLGSIREMTSMRAMFRGAMGGRGPGGGGPGGPGSGGGPAPAGE